MKQYFKNSQLIFAASGLLVACNSTDPTATNIDEEVLAAVVEADAPPIDIADITPGTLIGADGVEMNAIAVHIVGDGENGTHNAIRVIAWVPAANADQKPPFNRMLRVGVRTRGSGDVPIGEAIPIARFDFETEQQGFAFYAEMGSGGKWMADDGEVTIAGLEITGEPQVCDLPEGIEIECTVATGTASGSFEFTATQFFSENGDVYEQPLTTFDLPAIQVNVNGGFGWRGMRKGRGRGRGWGFGG